MSFKIINTLFNNVLIIKSESYRDNRGTFSEKFNTSEFNRLGLNINISQTNVSISEDHVFRGMHYQMPPYCQGKLVTCLQGSILDFIADIRISSPTFGKCTPIKLTGNNNTIIYIPPGFAHGFYANDSDSTSIFMYMCTNVYVPKNDRSISYKTKSFQLESYLGNLTNLIISNKDLTAKTMEDSMEDLNDLDNWLQRNAGHTNDEDTY